MKNSNLKKLLGDLRAPPSVDFFTLRRVRTLQRTHHARDGVPESNHVFDSEGLMIEVFVDGFLAYGATPDFRLTSIQRTLDRAIELATLGSKHSVFPFSRELRTPFKGERIFKPKIPLKEKAPSEIITDLIAICKKLKINDRIVRTTAGCLLTENEVEIVSSHGTEAYQSQNFIGTDFRATAKKDSIIQSRSSGGMHDNYHQGGLEFYFPKNNDAEIRRVAEEAIRLTEAESCPTGTHDLILSPGQMILQIHESIGHPLELDRILGDERNFAGWSFVKPEDFGRLRYGSELMNIVFDPNVETECASSLFDDTATPTQKEYLIKNGILCRGIGGIESQMRSGLPGSASTRACSWNRPPIDRMANLNLEPGKSSMKEIIESVEFGVWMDTNRSWSIDDFRRKFQFGCEFGKLIVEGKIKGVVRDCNYRGISVDFWNRLKKVGNASTTGIHGTPFCGKGEPNQVINVGHSSPTCLFSNVEIFGGAQ